MSDPQATTPDNILSYATVPPPSRRGLGVMAVCATLLWPGLGHWLVGAKKRGGIIALIAIGITTLSLVCLIFVPLFPTLMVLVPAWLLFQIGSLVDAGLSARKSTGSVISGSWMRFLAAVLCIAIGMFAHPSLIVALMVRAKVAEAFVLPTGSMEPTLYPRDRIMCHKNLAWNRWDVVVFTAKDGNKWVKRIVGLPGEKVEIIDDQGIRINDQLLTPPPGAGPYNSLVVPSPDRKNPRRLDEKGCMGNPIVLGPGEFYALGDDPLISGDSRMAGPFATTEIVGVVTYVYWPPKHWKKLR